MKIVLSLLLFVPLAFGQFSSNAKKLQGKAVAPCPAPADGDAYIWNAGTSKFECAAQSGAPGPAGYSILSGEAVPDAGVGVNGDFYIRQPATTPCLYGPKSGGAWPGACVSLVGPTGPKGDKGDTGDTGATGVGATDPTPMPTPAAAITLTAPRGYGICTNTCTVTLPVPAAGYEFCIRNANNVSTTITLAAIANVYYELTARTGYTADVGHKLVSGGAVTDQICVVGLDATHYLTMSFNGTWTDTP